MRGPKPLLLVTLPEMPFWEVLVPFRAEPVGNVGRNPLRFESIEKKDKAEETMTGR